MAHARAVESRGPAQSRPDDRPGDDGTRRPGDARFTAYSGLRAIGKPAPGETVVVAAASGPVGSLVGQLAKLAGARAVASREALRSART